MDDPVAPQTESLGEDHGSRNPGSDVLKQMKT